MYYLVSGTGDGSFEWVIKADSEESAKQNAMKDLSADDKITSIKELSMDECIKLGYKELSNEIKRYYFESHYDMKTITVREYAEIEKQFKENSDGYYKALKEFNEKLRLIRLLNSVAFQSVELTVNVLFCGFGVSKILFHTVVNILFTLSLFKAFTLFIQFVE